MCIWKCTSLFTVLPFGQFFTMYIQIHIIEILMKLYDFLLFLSIPKKHVPSNNQKHVRKSSIPFKMHSNFFLFHTQHVRPFTSNVEYFCLCVTVLSAFWIYSCWVANIWREWGIEKHWKWLSYHFVLQFHTSDLEIVM